MQLRAPASVASEDEPEMELSPLALGRAYGAERCSRLFLGEGMAALLVSRFVLVEAPESLGVER